MRWLSCDDPRPELAERAGEVELLVAVEHAAPQARPATPGAGVPLERGLESRSPGGRTRPRAGTLPSQYRATMVSARETRLPRSLARSAL